MMNLKNLKIGTQLKLAFAALLLFVMVLGVVSYIQSDEIYRQTETMYNHPLQVRRAIGSLETCILLIRVGERDLMLAKSDQEKQDAIQSMELNAANALRQFNVLESHYLGPPSDIDEAYKAFISWNTSRQENTKLALSGEPEKAKENILSAGTVRVYRENLMTKIKKIDDFAKKKGDELFSASMELKDSLNRQLILLVAAILLLSLLISSILLRTIRKPIDELTDAAKRFHNGDMDARSSYYSKY